MRISTLRPTIYRSVALLTGVLLLVALGVSRWPETDGGILGIPLSSALVVGGAALAVFGLRGDRSWRLGNTLGGLSLTFFGLNSFLHGKLLIPTLALILASFIETVVSIVRDLRSRHS